MNYTRRIAHLQAKLRRKKVDALLVSKPSNRRYLCGYRCSDHSIEEISGILLVPARGDIYLLTDFRFKLQAERDVPWAEILIYPNGLLKLLRKILPSMGINSVAFESHYTLHSLSQKMTANLKKVGIRLVPLYNIVETLREEKDTKEIELIRNAVRLNEEVFAKIYGSLSDYKTEIDIALDIELTMRRKGAEAPSFATIVASGTNSALPHACPSNNAVQINAPLTIDMGLVLDGYCSDMTRSMVPGKASKRYIQIHRLVRKAQLAGMAAVRAGARACDVDKAARSIIANGGYGKFFGHSLGHGVGLDVHEEPRLSPRSTKKLKSGMIVTVEPGIYIPDWGGIRLENMVVVREGGCENLNEDTTCLDL